MNNYNPKIKKFLDSFKAETATVPVVIDLLIQDLKSIGYPQPDIDEIVLSMDEALTNAIQETIRKEENIFYHTDSEHREITVSYIITSELFDTTIIDHGKGLDLLKSQKETPSSESVDYFNQLFNYSLNGKITGLKVRLNGQEIVLKGIGAGLKIMTAFMDSITIDLIDKEKFISNSISDFTDGTILNMKRKRRY